PEAHVALDLQLGAHARPEQSVVVLPRAWVADLGAGRVDEALEDQVPVRTPEGLLRRPPEVLSEQTPRLPHLKGARQVEPVLQARNSGVVARDDRFRIAPDAEQAAGDLLFVGDQAIAERVLTPERHPDLMSERLRARLRLAAEAARVQQ